MNRHKIHENIVSARESIKQNQLEEADNKLEEIQTSIEGGLLKNFTN